MAKRALADVLWEAANERLWDGRGDYSNSPLGKFRYSCDAIRNSRGTKIAAKFVEELGCDTESINLFKSARYGHRRQGVRYMWLLLAMHVAEDEKIMVEAS